MTESEATEIDKIRALYDSLIAAWNARDAAAWAAACDDDTLVIGYDGSQMRGAPDIGATLQGIFDHHRTGAYVCIVREVTLLAAGVAALRADTGLVPAGALEINPATIAIQTLVAKKTSGTWRVVQFQNTPAQFHGRPEAAAAFLKGLRAEMGRRVA